MLKAQIEENESEEYEPNMSYNSSQEAFCYDNMNNISPHNDQEEEKQDKGVSPRHNF